MEQGANVAGIAVIITVYNKEAFLRDAIDSVLSQHLCVSADSSTPAISTLSCATPATTIPASSASTTPVLSVILCDDGSTDSSRAICAEYASRYSLSKNCDPDNDAIQSSERENAEETTGGGKGGSLGKRVDGTPSCVRVFDITDGVHRGVVGNFLHCLEFALSLNVRYISQIDSDDILADPDFLRRQTTFLDSHPEAQAACSKFFLIAEKDTLATLSYRSEELLYPRESTYRDLRITPERLLTRNNTLVAGGVTYRAEHLREYLDSFASAEDATQDLPLWLFLSQKGKFYGCDVQSLAYRNLAESVSRSEDIETQLKFQHASLSTRQRFIEYLRRHIPTRPLNDATQVYSTHDRSSRGCCPGGRYAREGYLKRLEGKARRLYQKKMLRHYAKLCPKDYARQLWKALRGAPSLIFSRDVWRSVGVYLKNIRKM